MGSCPREIPSLITHLKIFLEDTRRKCHMALHGRYTVKMLERVPRNPFTAGHVCPRARLCNLGAARGTGWTKGN
jgi:hypothetical protein